MFKQILIIFFLCFSLTGCSRAFWASDWDKAETERIQANFLERQTIAIEKIATLLEAHQCTK